MKNMTFFSLIAVIIVLSIDMEKDLNQFLFSDNSATSSKYIDQVPVDAQVNEHQPKSIELSFDTSEIYGTYLVSDGATIITSSPSSSGSAVGAYAKIFPQAGLILH